LLTKGGLPERQKAHQAGHPLTGDSAKHVLAHNEFFWYWLSTNCLLFSVILHSSFGRQSRRRRCFLISVGGV